MTESNNDDNAKNDKKLAVKNVTATDSPLAAETLIGWINSRRSMGNLDAPAPTRAQIEAAIECAATAPDHKKLNPWRFIVTQGKARHQLGQALLEAAQEKAAQEGEVLSEKDIKKPKVCHCEHLLSLLWSLKYKRIKKFLPSSRC